MAILVCGEKARMKKKSTYRKSQTFLSSVINSCMATQLGMEMAGDMWFLQRRFQETLPFQLSCPWVRQALYSQKERAWPVSKEKQSCASCSISFSPAIQFRRGAKLYIKVPPYVLTVGTSHRGFFSCHSVSTSQRFVSSVFPLMTQKETWLVEISIA